MKINFKGALEKYKRAHFLTLSLTGWSTQLATQYFIGFGYESYALFALVSRLYMYM